MSILYRGPSIAAAWPNEPNLVGSIYGRLSIKIAHLVLIPLQTWSTQAILVADWSIPKKSQPYIHDNISHTKYLNTSYFLKTLLKNSDRYGGTLAYT
jgi:hypothetical protein